eukprot:CAMPEP_0175823724 /NCGR_PEP_ID=MMETSP0107_2-20121207/10355_1 /TAXON_ID=195067 ORGANISM="Goniomonas pacifica, Strain CCMP1869" /NCGR_SAMPLE_ID=MMETSP0107_2 /ASSEMBLY_ACC=CAM_ASM_000203 /LENGTH=279 /DNA_ID=CAMNT_0017136257 /DNA_START=337 /DNA_END=1172 /DNA_ORIENTATION=-
MALPMCPYLKVDAPVLRAEVRDSQNLDTVATVASTVPELLIAVKGRRAEDCEGGTIHCPNCVRKGASRPLSCVSRGLAEILKRWPLYLVLALCVNKHRQNVVEVVQGRPNRHVKVCAQAMEACGICHPSQEQCNGCGCWNRACVRAGDSPTVLKLCVNITTVDCGAGNLVFNEVDEVLKSSFGHAEEVLELVVVDSNQNLSHHVVPIAVLPHACPNSALWWAWSDDMRQLRATKRRGNQEVELGVQTPHRSANKSRALLLRGSSSDAAGAVCASGRRLP